MDRGRAALIADLTCVPTSTGDNETYALGPEVMAAEIVRTPEPSGARIRPFLGPWTIEAGLGLYDAELGVECLPEETPTGAICAPDARVTRTMFTNAGCSAPLELVAVSPACGVPPPRFGGFVERVPLGGG